MHLMSKAEKTEFLADTGNEPGGGDFKYYMSNYDYIATDGGEVLKLKRPSIEKTIWYDDEQPDPSKKCGVEALFMSENASQFFDWQMSAWKASRDELAATGCRVGGWREAPALVFEPHTKTYHVATWEETRYRLEETARDLTETETAELLGILGDLREAHKKRLASYWKRYGHKVRVSGYWRNR